ncbi:MAG: EAL domain-containing protein [Asticcacaulis sp.]
MIRDLRKKALLVAIFLFTCSVFGLSGLFINDELIKTSNKAQIKELSQKLIARSELAVDYAIITLGDLYAAGATDCDSSSIQMMRDSIAQRGAIKNIRVLGGEGQFLCSGLMDEPTLRAQTAVHDFPSTNKNYFLRRLENDPAGTFEVVWNTDQDNRLESVVNIDMILFDIFPSELRDQSFAHLYIGNKSLVAEHHPEGIVTPSDKLLRFEARSDRYPVHVALYVKPADLVRWNNQSRPLVLLIALSVGALVALLINRLVSRPISDLERLRQGLKRREFQPYFQPIFDLRTRDILGCEVLMRWIRDGQVVQRPDQFVPVAEKSGLIIPMTEALMRQSLELLAPFLGQMPHFKVAFNITPEHFTQPEFLTTLGKIVDTSGVNRGQIVLELTERQAFTDSDKARTAVIAAREAGFRISLDDTGSGHNGLSYIQDLPVDIIKIDKKFVDLVHKDATAIAIVRMLVTLAADLGLRTVGEGVETDDQRSALLDCGVHEGQGYLVSAPLPYDRFVALFSTSPAMPQSLEAA